MFNFILEIVCAFLMAMSLIFIVIELRSRFDKSFLIFGITNILMSIFDLIDIWIQPTAQILYWTRIQHMIIAFFPAFIAWYLTIMLRKTNFTIIRLMFFMGCCFSPLFFTNLMLVPTKKEIGSTLLYNVTFAPYMILTIILLAFYLFKNLSQCSGKEKKVLLFHLFGGLALGICGILDLISVFVGYRIVPQFVNFTTPGLLLFGLIVTYVFIDRLTAIIQDREVTFGKLQQAYKEMEEVQSLKELGQSTAIINHEIKNYTFIISGYAEFLLEQAPLSDKHKKMLCSISDTAIKMSEFSKEILDFSRAKIMGDKRPLALFSLIQGCIQTHFQNKQESIIIENCQNELYVHGDWNKLEHVFVNIFKNAFEAEAKQISIKALRRDFVLLLVIEDDGVGCTEEQLGNLFKSFYTTKKGTGGTGLGMCVMRSIIESHGGYISAYSKNILANGLHGINLNLAFPLYQDEKTDSLDKKDSVLLIKDGIQNLAQVIRVFKNVFVKPYIVQNVEGIDSKKIPLATIAVFASAQQIEKFKAAFKDIEKTHTIIDRSPNVVFVINESKAKILQSFSENYVLETLKE